MIKSKKENIEEQLLDLCSDEEFRFGVECAVCKNILSTDSIRFVKAGIEPKSHGQKIIFETIYRRDKLLEREKAINSLSANLNLCPVCGHIVCNNCFVITDDIDICSDCAKKLGVTGKTVGSRE